MILIAVVAVTAPLTMIRALEDAQASEQRSAHWSQFDAAPDVTALKRCIRSTPDARILVLGDDTFAARAGATGGLATMMQPRNMAEGRLAADNVRAFVKEWDVDYLLVIGPKKPRSILNMINTEAVIGCKAELYRLAR